MPETSPEIASAHPPDRFRWAIAVYAAIALSMIFIAIAFSKDWDLGGFFFIFLTTPLVLLCMFIISVVKVFQRKYRMSVSILFAGLIYLATSSLLLKSSSELHAEILWNLHRNEYKAAVINQSAPDSSVKHIYWFGWGWAGSGTDMYLAYDPTNSLPHRDVQTGRFGRLECDKVWKVHRLQKDWYGVTFNTNEGWEDSCDATPSPKSLATSP